MQPNHTSASTADPTTRNNPYALNRSTMLAALRGTGEAGTSRIPARMITLRLERVLAERVSGQAVPFDGETGIEAVLAELATLLPSFGSRTSEGRLVGLYGTGSTRHDSSVNVRVELCAGGQVAYEVGPTPYVFSILQVIEGIDRRLHMATQRLGLDYVLLAEGYNPSASTPLDVPLVPEARWTLLNAYLGQTGRYARDWMRCACATQATLGFATESEAMDAYRLAVALSPVLSFLCDNVRSFRGMGARRSPRMVRSVMYDEVDPARTGVVPGTFDKDFSAERYLDWAEGLQPIMLVEQHGNTSSTGKRTLGDVMSQRKLTGTEAQGLLASAMPYVRLGSGMQLLGVDALRPRMAAGYAVLLKGLFLNAPALYAASALVGSVSEQDVETAVHELRVRGWEASVYGRPVGELADNLMRIARQSTDDADEWRLFEELCELWQVRMVPRDAFVHQEIRAQRGW